MADGHSAQGTPRRESTLTGVPGVRIEQLNRHRAVIANTTTDANGRFPFDSFTETEEDGVRIVKPAGSSEPDAKLIGFLVSTGNGHARVGFRDPKRFAATRVTGVGMVRVLVVEDERDLRSAISQTLLEEGFVIDEAADGEVAIFKATAWDYDAVVLDLMLPVKNGWEVLEALRKVKATPVLILSARDQVGDRVRGLDGGADDYVVKPFSLVELVARLRALIRRASGKAESILTAGDVTINLSKRTVEKAGRPVVLTAREYAILELLTLHRGKLITRSVIYDHIFGEDDDSLSNLVDVHISHIRKKLGADLIETRRGQGYIVND